MTWKDGEPVNQIIETTVGRVLFNAVCSKEVGYLNEILTKKSFVKSSAMF